MGVGRRRAAATGLCIVALGLGAAVLGPPAGPSPRLHAAAAPGQPQTVRFWVPARGGYLAAWQQAARIAGERHPDVAVAVEPIWADYGARLTLALAEGRAPDLVAVGPELAARLASRGWLADVTAVVEPYRPPAAAVRPFVWQGRIWAVPGVLDPVVLYVNVAALAAAGVDAAEALDWDGLLGLARRVAASGRAGWATVFNGWPPLAMFVWQAGGALLEPEGQPWSDEAAVVRAAEYYRTFVAEGLSPPAPESWTRPADVPFRAGELAFAMALLSDPLEIPGAPSPFRPGEPPVAPPGGTYTARVLPVPAGPGGADTWASVEGAAAPWPASPRALSALAYLAEALAQMGWRPPTAGRRGAEPVAPVAMARARTLPAHPAFLEFDAAWWQHVVAPLLAPAGPVEVAASVRRAGPILAQVLGGPLP